MRLGVGGKKKKERMLLVYLKFKMPIESSSENIQYGAGA